MDSITDKAEVYVSQLLTDKLRPEFLFHNLRHTQRVVEKCNEIAEATDLPNEEKNTLVLASWFHHTGYTRSTTQVKEESCAIATGFLAEENVDQIAIDAVCGLIMATKSNYEPKTKLEEIIQDGVSSYIAQKDFRAISELLREEHIKTEKEAFDISMWRKKNVQMFRVSHRFYTDYAQENWQKGKDKNLRRLIKGRKKEKRLVKKAKLKAKFKDKSPDRGIQTLYRTTLRNHIKLSDIADTKSNILLSVNAIIISLALSNLIPKLDNPSNDYLIIPTLIFIVFSIISMVLSISATRPNVTSGTFTKEDVAKKRVNLLFFGNFHRMKLTDYEEAIEVMLGDKDYIYRSLTKDLYFLGVVLERKYRILRWTYTIFMLGMILSVIAFGVALKYFGPERIMDVI